MFRSSMMRWVIGVVAVIAILGLLRFKPWQRGATQESAANTQARQELDVGFLPVT